MLEKIAYDSQELKSFPSAHKMLTRDTPVKMTLRQVWEQAERVGADLVRRRNAEAKEMNEGRPPKPPANPPDLLVVSPDGARLQDRSRPPGRRWCEYKAAVVYRAARDEEAREGTRDDPQPECHWRFKTTLGKRQQAGKKTYHDPEPEVKTFTATTENIDRFPVYVELEAKRRGLMEADTVAVVGDGGSFVWRTSKEICEARVARGKPVFEILDTMHANSHLAAAAKAAWGGRSSAQAVKWLNARLCELWAGKAGKLIRALEKKAEGLGPRPDPPAAGEPDDRRGEPIDEERGEAELPPEVVLWRCRDYFEKNRERIRYDVFRRHGLPLTSAHIESGIGQTNERVKASKKAWLLEHAEEMLALRCQALSEDGRWDDYFDKLRRGEIEIETRGRMAKRPTLPPEPVSPQTKAA
jgi:hypothetical protein